METLWSKALWQQFGAALDMLDNALAACPDSLWRERLWRASPPEMVPPLFAEFWYVAYHTLVWTDLYLSGGSEEEFIASTPFAQKEFASTEVAPEPYSKAELRAYLATVRQKCQSTLSALTDEQARRPIVAYSWLAEPPISFLELQLYNLRHAQEHEGQLAFVLGQHGIPDEAVDWVARAKNDPSST